MSSKADVSLLLIGTELTNGTIQDTHGRYIASRLTELGFTVKKISLVSDDLSGTEDLRNLTGCSDVIIVSGGLGPTSDDITREMLAGLSCGSLVFRQDVWEDIASRYDVRKGQSNRRQAFVPEHFTIIQNTEGTAPGLRGTVDSTLLYALPGPPHEMRTMFDRAVVPDLVQNFHLEPAEFLEATCFLLSESLLEDVCGRFPRSGVTWGTRASEGGIHLYLRGGIKQEREAFLEFLQEHLGKERLKEGAVDLPSHTVSLFKDLKYSFSSAESCTGGLFSKLVTDVPGSSDVFPGGVVSYSSGTKAAYLGLDRSEIETHGAVSGETAAAMAQSVRELSGSDIGISFTGIAGPGGGSTEVPVGTVWIGIADRDGDVRTFPFRFKGSRNRIRRKAVSAGFLLLEIWVTEKKRLDSYRKWQYI